jgi:hypothetical protein
MRIFSPSPKACLRVALGLLLGCASGPLAASFEPRDDAAPAPQSFELIPAERAGELPVELRAQDNVPSFAEALGLPAASGSHKVRLQWIVRENREPSGYRVTLVAADGLPGHLAARWWIPSTQGIALGNGFTAYAAEIVLALDGEEPVAAAIEAVDSAGLATVLGVRHTVATADPAADIAIIARPETSSLHPTALLANRLAPAARAATVAQASYPSLPGAVVAATSAARLSSLDPDAAASPRGPPTARVTA